MTQRQLQKSTLALKQHREGNHPDDYSRLTYRKLLEEVCRFANVLKMHGVNKGDRVSIYMPMIMELPIAMLACARIGAVHSIVVSIYNSTFDTLHTCPFSTSELSSSEHCSRALRPCGVES